MTVCGTDADRPARESLTLTLCLTGCAFEAQADPPRLSKKITSRAATPLPLATMLFLFFDFARLQYARRVFTGIHRGVSLYRYQLGHRRTATASCRSLNAP